MSTKIRLQRHGHKGYAHYTIVIADSRSPRDGRFIERIGVYNPNTNPATVELKFDRALYWVETGAQPTDTVHNILKGEGVMLMKHLRGGVKKGAFSEEVAQQKFDAWKQEKATNLNKVSEKAEADKKAAAKARLEAEKKENEAVAKRVAEKKAAAIAAAAPAPEAAPETPAAESTEAPTAAPAEEAKPAEAPAEEAKPAE